MAQSLGPGASRAQAARPPGAEEVVRRGLKSARTARRRRLPGGLVPCFCMRHTVVISDIHLSEVERRSGPWMRYRQRPFAPDEQIAAMLGAVLEAVHPNSELTVVL